MRRLGLVIALLLAMALFAVAPVAQAVPDPDSSQLRAAITQEGVYRHVVALNNIATLNGGERAAGTAGHVASVDYVTGLLEDAGYSVTVQPFDFAFFDELSPARFERVSPDPRTFVNGDEFITMTYSGSGDTTAPLQAVDITIPPTPEPSSTSGCEASDFAGFTAGNVALIQRGTCTFFEKATNAQAAGASAVVIFNEGQPGREALFAGTSGRRGSASR